MWLHVYGIQYTAKPAAVYIYPFLRLGKTTLLDQKGWWSIVFCLKEELLFKHLFPYPTLELTITRLGKKIQNANTIILLRKGGFYRKPPRLP